MKNLKNYFIFIASIAILLGVCTFHAFAEEVKENTEAKDTLIAREVAPVPKESCGFEMPTETVYDAKIVTVRKKLRVETGESFRVKVFVKNNGNMPWFSNKSTCMGPKAFLGTDRDKDRASVFYSNLNESDNNWYSESRVSMDQLRVDPGDIASFTFWSVAGNDPDIYKEYMTPLIESVTWIENAGFSYELMVGDTGESLSDVRKKLLFADFSGSVSDINLNGEKAMMVDLSDQTVNLTLDGRVVRTFRISTGAAATPTPVGETEIILKQEVRVGVKPPHYIMPKYMMFRAGGYGFHALPSLGNDGGVFWTEARNHIGIPVSHGCIRMLPEEANFAYEFADIGTKVVVQR